MWAGGEHLSSRYITQKGNQKDIIMNKKICGAKLVAFGDSITAGEGIPEGSKNWTDLISAAFNLKLLNAGIGGNTSSQGLLRMERDVLSHSPDFVTICFGMNDHCMVEKGIPRVSLSVFRENINEMVKKVRSINAVPILITTNYIIEGSEKEYYYSRHDKTFYEQAGGAQAWLDRYIDQVRKIALENNTELIDIRKICDLYDPYDFLRTLKNSNTDDGVHPYNLGAAVYAENIISYFKEKFL